PKSAAKGKGQSDFSDWPLFNAGNDLRSHTLSRAVPSAQRGLTSVFGMGTGGSPAVRSPTSRSCQLSAVSSQLLAEVTSCADGQQTWWLQRTAGSSPSRCSGSE